MLIGCGKTAVSPQPLPTLVATAVIPTLPTVIPTLPIATLPTPIPQATNSPIPPTAVPPTPTPTQPLSLAVPDAWQTAVSQALTNSSTSQVWQIVASDTAANAQLVENGSGSLVWQEPIVLAVPFTTEWETISQADAESILADGHTLVTVLSWSKLTPEQKPLRIDGRFPTDPNYPLQNRLSLQAEAGQETAVAELLPILQNALAPEAVVHLASVGDIMLDRGLGVAIQQGNLAYPFANVAALLQAADFTVGNMESALGDVGLPQEKSYPFRAPPAAAQSLALAGFDLVSLANNHGMDYGPEALLQGIGLLEAQGVVPIGAGANFSEAHRPHIIQIDGLSLAFLGYVNVPVEVTGFDTAVWTATENSPGLAWAAPELIANDVTAVREETDLVIVLLHSSYEYVEAPSEAQMAAARAAIDAGADLVIGHHAHILQGIEFYNEGVIVYGLGNFAFEISGPPETAVLNVWLDQNGVRSLELVPAIVQTGGQPRLANETEAAPILRQVYHLTRILNRR
ncbi:MAG: CapA family protein [Chloroflexi bacterium]|nr:CapA family protein [Chloroflexota bacterium]